MNICLFRNRQFLIISEQKFKRKRQVEAEEEIKEKLVVKDTKDKGKEELKESMDLKEVKHLYK